jgi:6-pyruvoyltetrahydropterin/6-carboxytetrahydropterin synthase
MLIYKEFVFEAAHLLPQAIAGTEKKYGRLHGHSYRVRVTLEGEPDAETGLVVPFEVFEKAIGSARDQLDHSFLNEDIDELGLPTLENIARWLWQNLANDLAGLTEVAVARDTCREGCIYRGPRAAA